MATTPNLGLPLIDSAMTADVPRDMNALANAVDTAVEEALADVSIPDASLTVKGKVQLSNKTDGTSENLAPTEKALGEVMFATQSVRAIINNRDGYGITENSGNAYVTTLTPSPTAYVEGLRITIKINAANTGAASINVNGLGVKSLLKPNGNALISGSLKVNSVYSFVYNGTAFILQGEGGEYGTATANDVRSGKTIGTENGLVNGTLVPYGSSSAGNFSVNIPASSYHSQSVTPGFEFIAARCDLPALAIISVQSMFNVGSGGGAPFTSISRTSLQMYNSFTSTTNYQVYLIQQSKG
jgi:hypothetical protein